MRYTWCLISVMESIAQDRARIDALGGCTKVADLLGLPKQGGAQRVSNWKSRGIPADVKLAYPEIFLVNMPLPSAARSSTATESVATPGA